MYCSLVREQEHTQTLLQIWSWRLKSVFGFLAERLNLKYPEETGEVFTCLTERGGKTEPVCVCVSLFMHVRVYFSVLSPSSLRTNETVSLWKNIIWKTASALDQKPTDLLSSAPHSTSSPSSNATRRLLPPYRAPLCHLNPMLGTQGIFNNGHVSECQCLQVFQLGAVLPFLLIPSL